MRTARRTTTRRTRAGTHTDGAVRPVTLPTVRGVLLLVASAAAVVIGVQTALATVLALGLVGLGALLLAVVVAVWVQVVLRRSGMQVQRLTSPAAVVRGTTAHVRLRVTGSRVPRSIVTRTDAVLLDRVDDHLAPRGGTVRLVLAAYGWQGSYTVAPWARGRWPLGPVTVRVSDPAGLVRTTVRGLGRSTLAVRPRPVTLAAQDAGDDRAGAVLSEAFTAGARVPSPDDSLLRAYVPGDDVRRVHWPTTARHHELMVRTDEHTPAQPVTLVLDRRLVAPAPSRPARAAEQDWPVELVASVGIATIEGGRPVRFRSSAPGEAPPGDQLDLDELFDVLTDLAPRPVAASGAAVLDDVLAVDGGTTVLVTDALGDDVLGPLARLATHAPAGSLRVVVTSDDDDARVTADTLAEHGWHVTLAPTPSDVQAVAAAVAP